MLAHESGHSCDGHDQRDCLPPLRAVRLRGLPAADVREHLQTVTNASRAIATCRRKVKTLPPR